MTGPPAIGDLGLMGDTRTAALVDTRGRVVWLCLPHFDGEPVFGDLIAGTEGGVFTLGPAGDAEVVERRYREGSAVLDTTWRPPSSGANERRPPRAGIEPERAPGGPASSRPRRPVALARRRCQAAGSMAVAASRMVTCPVSPSTRTTVPSGRSVVAPV